MDMDVHHRTLSHSRPAQGPSSEDGQAASQGAEAEEGRCLSTRGPVTGTRHKARERCSTGHTHGHVEDAPHREGDWKRGWKWATVPTLPT